MVSNREDALDLMQDVFMSVFRNLASFRGESPFKGWMFKIAHYRCIEFYRRKRPMQSLDDSPEFDQEDETSCPELSATSGQRAKEIKAALAILPINQKLVVEMKFFQHATFEEIGAPIGYFDKHCEIEIVQRAG